MTFSKTKLPVRIRAERSVQPEDALDVSESMLNYTFQQAKDVLSQRRKLENMQGKLSVCHVSLDCRSTVLTSNQLKNNIKEFIWILFIINW